MSLVNCPVTYLEGDCYRGRFAPSPSGNLHFGSLCTALASYLRAKQNNGQWLLRIDDIDTPRIVPGSAQNIQNTLLAHGLVWDEEVFLQSEQIPRYRDVLSWLESQQKVYRCNCSRKAIRALGTNYTGVCRDKRDVIAPYAIRFKNDLAVTEFEDVVQGMVNIDQPVASEDFVLWRRDDLVAYHLAAALDDIEQGITEIVRGADLIQPSACQLNLFRLFSIPSPKYLHIPVAESKKGFKLSKQNHATELNNQNARDNLFYALRFIGATPPTELRTASVDELIQWGISHWRVQMLASSHAILLSEIIDNKEYIDSIS